MYRCRTLCTTLLTLLLSALLWANEGEAGRNPNDPLDQGGETCAQAVAITTLPYCDTGTTAGHVNDYPVQCQTGSTAPDVVYSITPPVTSVLSFSLCGSAYNTALTIWRGCPSQGGVLVCCSDNVCGDDACCSGVTLLANTQYFVIVDGGLAPNSGSYTLNVVQGQSCPETPCQNPCPFPNLDVEPNNNCQIPQTTLTCGDTVCGFMEPNANDFYVFTVPGPGSQNVAIDVFGDDTPGWFPFGQGLNPRIEVQTCSTTFGNDSNSGVGEDARLDSLCLAPGTYLLRVSAEPQSNSGPYIVAIHCEPCVSDTCPLPSRDVEPINNNCGANVPNVTCDERLCGEISTTADRDWYRLSFTQFPCSDIRIEIFGDDTPGHWPFGQGLNPKVSIWSNDCLVMIAQDDDGGIGLDSRLDSLCIPAGSYFILVESSSDFGPYELAVTCTGCDCPSCPYPDLDNEPNNICAGGGGVISCGDTVCGFQELGANDYYYFRVLGPGCQNVTIDVFGDDTPGYYPFGQGLNPLVQLLSSDCATNLAFDNSSGVGEDARIDSLCLAPGTYRLRVAGQPQATNFGPYIIATSCSPCACPDVCNYENRDNEGVNSVCATFNPPMICGDTLCGELSLMDSQDWYLITVVGPGSIRLKVDVFGDDTPGYYPFGMGLNPSVGVFGDGCLTFLGSDNDSGIGLDAHLEICLTQGTYNIIVQAEDLDYGPYILATACEPCDTCPYPDFDVEPLNNNCGTNNEVLHCNAAVCGEIFGNVAPDQDWYVLQLTQCTQLFIDVLGDDSPGFYPFGRGLNPAIELWSADCSSLLYQDFNSGLGEDAQLNTPCLEPGLYMIRVYGELATQGPYIMFIGCESCTCGPPCEVPCPQGALLENEPCPAFVDTVNGGCDSEPRHFLPLQCDQFYCGTGYAGPNHIDTDWYRLAFTAPTQVRLCVNSEFDGYLNLYVRGPRLDGCEPLDLVECTFITGCQGFQCLSACVPPGIYYAEFRAAGFQFVNCWDYVIGMGCSGCEATVCEAPDSVVIHYPAAFGIGNPLQDVELFWPPVPGATEYRIYRTNANNDPTFIPSPATYIAGTSDTFYVHENVVSFGPEEIWIYYVVSYCEYTTEPCDIAPAAIIPKIPGVIEPKE